MFNKFLKIFKIRPRDFHRLPRVVKLVLILVLLIVGRGAYALYGDLKVSSRVLMMEAVYFKSWAFAESMLSDSQTPTAYLASIAGDDYMILNKIIICESGWDPEAVNPIPPHAKGLFQFMPVTWNYYGEGNILNPYDNIRAGVELYRAEGTRPWLASKHCWQK